MTPRRIDAAAFVMGMIPAFLQGGLMDDSPWPVRLALNLLCPGFLIGLPILQVVNWIGLPSIGFYFLVSILVNGLIFGLASHLIRHARKGQRLPRLSLALGMGAWVIWGVISTGIAWPRPEPPLARVDLASPLAGRWEGGRHAARGDPSVTLVCHPRADSTLGGYLYVSGHDMGSFENGVYARDSLCFEIVGFRQAAHFDSTTMAMVISVGGFNDAAELRRVSADTTRPAMGR
jgi:hypothetical protein